MGGIGDMGAGAKIDFTENSADLQIPKEIYLRILNKAITQTQTDIIELEAALPVGDYERIQAISHRLKGDYGNLRIAGLSSLGKELNEEVREGKDKEKMFALVNDFKQAFQQLKQLAVSG